MSYEEWQRAATLAYADELLYLETHGWSEAHPTGTGGGCTALEAKCRDMVLTATDGDHCLVRGREDGEQSDGWLVTIMHESYDEDLYGEGATLTEAVRSALADLAPEDSRPDQ